MHGRRDQAQHLAAGRAHGRAADQDPAARSATSLITPSLPALWMKPRLDSSSCASPVPTSRPASRAWRLGEPDGADLGVGERHPADGAVVGPRPVLAEQAAGGHGVLVHRHVGERALAGDVADRPEPLPDPHLLVGVQRPGAGSSPTVSRPMSERLGRRPAATSSWSASRSAPSTTRWNAPSWTPARSSRRCARRSRRAPNAARTTSDDSGSSRAEDPVGTLEHGHPDPEPAERLGELAARSRRRR